MPPTNVRRFLGPLLAVLALTLAACSSDSGSNAESTVESSPPSSETATTTTDTDTDTLPACDDRRVAVATDIDATLTMSDLEVITQISDVAYDPLERPDASELFQAYSDRGYYIVYITARPDTIEFAGTDASAVEVTEDWLIAHDFPIGDGIGELHLLPEDAVNAVSYKAGVVADLIAEGYEFPYAYGNAEFDFEGFAQGGVDPDGIFAIGPGVGYEGTTAIEGDGYTDQLATQVDPLAVECERQ